MAKAKQKTTKTQKAKTKATSRTSSRRGTDKSVPKTTRDHYRAGPFFIKWERPDGSIKVTEYNYDPKDRYTKGYTRKGWIHFARISGESVGWKYLGLAKKSKRTSSPLKFT